MIELELNKPVKVSIMGTIYDVVLLTDEDLAMDLNDAIGNNGGYCDPYEKIISIAQYNTSKVDFKHIEKVWEINLRYEIVHAFMFESGLWCDSFIYDGHWAMNEEMIDWFAIQSQKIFEVFWKFGLVHINTHRLRDQKDDFEKVDWTITPTKGGRETVQVTEANRIQNENVLRDQTSRFCCPPVEKDSFDIHCGCGGSYPH